LKKDNGSIETLRVGSALEQELTGFDSRKQSKQEPQYYDMQAIKYSPPHMKKKPEKFNPPAFEKTTIDQNWISLQLKKLDYCKILKDQDIKTLMKAMFLKEFEQD